ncbi:YdbH family protein [Enterobacter kobei]|uniref:YdbH family protein n=1 Tax=Enterobacter kobei TaxID=208224 RepID=UPI000B3CC470|nr:YdbH family protein [Enterobacter kobei]MBT1798088.1 YdbH family protein [Enterobacter kobei]MBW7696868.1 YdbH family protein [Enterobacter kobei]MBW7773683.1 YdbH family protein [Enterobacter kobei]MCK6863956.1 YdbH family protein [Enterobacter kobei]MCO7422299.1 YdbH family protein [Enterobacter kobei]
MKGKYKAALALLLLFILLPLTLLMTLAQWVPTLAGIWLPVGTRIAFEESPKLTRHALVIPDLRYLVEECEIARIENVTLSHPSRWQLDIGALDLNAVCLSKIPQSAPSTVAPKTLAQWQAVLPNTWLTIHRLTLSPWQQWQGELKASLTPSSQEIAYKGEQVSIKGTLRGQTLSVSQFDVQLPDQPQPIKLVGEFTLPLVPDGVPVKGHAVATFNVPQLTSLVDADLDWEDNRGQLVVMARDNPDPLLDLPWQVTAEQLNISDGRWNWDLSGMPLSGRVSLRADNWQQGLEKATLTGRLNVLTHGDAGKGNAVLNIGPGRLSMENSDMPLHLSGEAKQNDLILYAKLPATLTGSLYEPQLAFEPGALLRSRGRIIDSLDIDEIRWPLAGVKLTQKGVDGRLQAILRAHENEMGDFELHLDGQANDFLPDSGIWQWRYWGKGSFTPMHARWDVAGKGEWRDKLIELTALSTGFDKLQYGTMEVSTPRLVLDQPVRWFRDAEKPTFSGALALNAGQTRFSGGSTLPPSVLTFSVDGTDPTVFQFKGDLHAEKIGPVQVNGRWDGERLRGQAWWPKQSLTVFQPLIPPDWKMTLRDGELYAQVAFSAAADQGFEAGGHGVLKAGSAWMPDNQINGVDFVLPFRFSKGTWSLGTRGPVTLRIGEVENLVTARNITADLQGDYPWTEDNPLLLTNVKVETLGGKITMQQLRMPQHDPALLRVDNISSSELIGAVNPKQFAMSGPVSGALPFWLDNEKWIIKDGWLTNPGPMTLRIDKDTADAIVKDNMVAGAAINWLRYMEISRSWTRINLDNLGELTMQATIKGTSRVDGKSSSVNLNYTHDENVFTLWRSLRFGDNLQTWFEQHAAIPGLRSSTGKESEEQQ